MKKIMLVLMFIPIMIISKGDAQEKTVLLKEKLINNNQYMIVARGYSKPGLTDPIQMNGTAKEAALLNAQVIARERFIVGFDVIQNGRAKKYTIGKGYADVVYILSYPGLKKYLRK